MKSVLLVTGSLILAGVSCGQLAAQPLAQPADDFAAAVPACIASLESGDNPPPADGWMPGRHMTGTPYGIAALKERNVDGAMEAMRHSREVFVLEGRGVALTQYYQSGNYVACTIEGEVEAAVQAQVAAQLADRLALGTPRDAAGRQVDELRKQYQLDNLTDTYRKDGLVVAMQRGTADRPDLLTVFLIKR